MNVVLFALDFGVCRRGVGGAKNEIRRPVAYAEVQARGGAVGAQRGDVVFVYRLDVLRKQTRADAPALVHAPGCGGSETQNREL